MMVEVCWNTHSPISAVTASDPDLLDGWPSGMQSGTVAMEMSGKLILSLPSEDQEFFRSRSFNQDMAPNPKSDLSVLSQPDSILELEIIEPATIPNYFWNLECRKRRVRNVQMDGKNGKGGRKGEGKSYWNNWNYSCCSLLDHGSNLKVVCICIRLSRTVEILMRSNLGGTECRPGCANLIRVTFEGSYHTY